MLISCPACKTTFAIPAKAVGTDGRKVKCSKCGHIWMQAPLAVDKEQFNNLLSVEPKESFGLPVRYKRYKLKVSLIVLLLLFLAGLGILQVFKQPDKYPTIAEKLNLPEYKGIRFHEFTVNSQLVDNKMNYSLKGSIVNTTAKKMKLPVVKISIYSKGGMKMAENTMAIAKEYIDPYETVPLNPEISGVSGNAESIELSFENWAEAALR